MLDLSKKKLLVIAPHPDDEVLGCGGLINKIIRQGGEVYVIFATVGLTQDFSSKGVSTESERAVEVEAVSKFLKFTGWKVAFPGNLYHLQLDQLAQKQIIHEIERGEKISLEETKPDIIAFPSLGDYNQDHRAVAQACFSACRPSPKTTKFVPDLILSYEEPMDGWSLDTAKPNLFVELSETDLKNKIKALELYKSQVRGKGHSRNSEVLHSLAVVRGATAGVPLAEAYYLHKFNL